MIVGIKVKEMRKMGCDIHLYAEKKSKYEHNLWVTMGNWKQDDDSKRVNQIEEDEIYTDGRNYNLFCALAGVRGGMFSEPTMISKPKGLPKDCSDLILNLAHAWGSDGHTHSYLTLKELEDFDWSPYGETCDDFKNEVFSKLKGLLEEKQTNEDIRIVFWFDN